MASCYANPALAERELGWKAAFGLDKMCKSIPFPSTLCVAGCPSPGPPLTAAFSLLQARTCGGGSCRIPQASARTEPWPEGSPGCQGQLGASPTCLPARLQSSWVQFQLPLLPLTWGRKAGASPASPLLILIPPPQVLCISQSRNTRKNRARALAPGARNTLMDQQREGVWLGPVATVGAAAPGLSLCPGRWPHPALTRVIEPKLQRKVPVPCCAWPLTRPAERAPSLRAGGRPGHSLSPALAQRQLLSPYLMVPGTPRPGCHVFHSHRDQSQPKAHVPPAQLPGEKTWWLPVAAPPHLLPSPPCMVLGTKPHLPHAPAHGCAPALPGCTQPPCCWCLVLLPHGLWQPLPKSHCQRLPRRRLCSAVKYWSYLLLAALTALLGTADAVSPVCCQLD